MEKQNVSGEMLQVLNLKPMKLKKEVQSNPILVGQEVMRRQKVAEKEEVSLDVLSFDINDMKERYIFPFNLNFKRKMNYKMKDGNNLLDLDR